MAVLSAYGAYSGAQAKADEYDASAETYDYQAEVYDQKEKLALKESNLSEVQAMDTQKIGSIERRKTILYGKQVIGAQKTGYGASGIRVDTGVSVDVREQTERAVAGDAMTIRANYAKEAYGYKLKAWKQRGEARTYHLSAINARKSAENARSSASKTRNMSPLGALASGLGSAANYKG